MTDLKDKILEAGINISARMKSAEWQRRVEESDKQVEKTLEKLRLDSKVDPNLLDEPATL